MKTRLVAFDLDDTLYPEREYVESGFEAVDLWLKANKGVGGFSELALDLFRAGNRGKIFDQALRELAVKVEDGLVSQLVAVYRGHCPRIRLFSDARPAIERLRGVAKLGLISDGYGQAQRQKVAALGIGPMFDRVVFTDDLGRENWKPSPSAFNLMMHEVGSDAAECVYVGDNTAKDFIAPNMLGWLTVLVLRKDGEYAGTSAQAPAPAYEAKKIIGSLAELEGALD